MKTIDETQRRGLLSAMTTLRDQERHFLADSVAAAIATLDYLYEVTDMSGLVDEIQTGDYEDRSWMIEALERAAEEVDRLSTMRRGIRLREFMNARQPLSDAIGDAYNNSHQDPAGRAADAVIKILASWQDGRNQGF